MNDREPGVATRRKMAATTRGLDAHVHFDEWDFNDLEWHVD